MIDSEVHIMIARHNVITAIDGNRDDRDAELLRQEESSALERSHLSRLSACPFGKHYYRHTVLKGVVSVVVSFLDLLWSALIHGNMLLFDVVVPYSFPLSDEELENWINKRLQAKEALYKAVVKIDRGATPEPVQ